MPKKKRTYFKIQNKLVPFIGRVAGTHLVAHHRREPRLPFCQSYEPSAGRDGKPYTILFISMFNHDISSYRSFVSTCFSDM